MHRKFRRTLTLLLALILSISAANTAFAQSNSSDNTGTIQVTVAPDRTPRDKHPCDLYYIAGLDGRVIPELEPYHLRIDLTTDDLHSATILASTLESIVLKDKIKPVQTGVTDEFGSLLFNNAGPGLYLLLTQDIRTAEKTYIAQPSLFMLTQRENLNIKTKWVIQDHPDEPEDPPRTILKVLKKWDDGNDKANRPDHIEVTLLRNGQEIETVKLGDKNNWRYVWHDLNAHARWSVVEHFDESNDEYEVEIRKTGTTIVLTNVKTHDEPVTPPVIPEIPENPPENPPEIPNEPTPTPEPEPEIPTPGPDFPTEPKLPQTGTTWYLIPILVIIGLALLTLSLCVNHRPDKKIKYLGSTLLILGVLTIFAAGVIVGLNQEAESFAENAVSDLQSKTTQKIDANLNIYTGQAVTPDYLLDTSRDMPVESIDGLDVVARLSIPELEIDLPVLSQWDNANAKSAPCRCSGTAYDGNLIIAGHSYKAHFRNLYDAAAGMRVILTDMDGNLFEYNITGTETIDEHDRETLDHGDWDMTLFTCTPDSRHRYLVHCELAGPDETTLR